MEYFGALIILLAMIAIGYTSYCIGHFFGHQKCQNKYESYLDKRVKTVYNSSNDNNTK
jgi:hypothetical protein